MKLMTGWIIMGCLLMAGTSVAEPEAGLGAWLYDMKDYYVQEIQDYNAAQNDESLKIKYLFCYTGTVEIPDATVPYYMYEISEYYRNQLPEMKIYPMVDGAGDFSSLSDDQVDSIARILADYYSKDEAADGIHLDIEPYQVSQVRLMEALKKYTDLPLTAAVSLMPFPDEGWKHMEFIVLMNYDYSSDLGEFRAAFDQKAAHYYASAVKNQGKLMIGVPAIATHHEYEVRVRKDNPDARLETQTSMWEYFSESLESYWTLVRGDKEKALLGYALWGFVPEEEPVGSYPRHNPYWYYPVRIQPEVWRLMLKEPTVMLQGF